MFSRSFLAAVGLALVSAAPAAAFRAQPRMALAGLAKKMRLQQIETLKQEVQADASHPVAKKMAEAGSLSAGTDLYDALKKVKGTVSVMAEYRRKSPASGFLQEVPPAEVLSTIFRTNGASGVSVMMDPSIGGCDADDFDGVVAEQKTAEGDYPGPLPVLFHDLIVDETQVALAASQGASAVTVSWGVNGAARAAELGDYAASLGLETVYQVDNTDALREVVSSGKASIVALMGASEEDGIAAASILPEDRSVIGIATVDVPGKAGEDLEEVAAAWKLRDAGWSCIWVSDILYRAGAAPHEDARAIIKAVKAKTSAVFGTPKGMSGQGEGAKEYLGYLEM